MHTNRILVHVKVFFKISNKHLYLFLYGSPPRGIILYTLLYFNRQNLRCLLSQNLLQSWVLQGPAWIVLTSSMLQRVCTPITTNIRISIRERLKHIYVHHLWRCVECPNLMVIITAVTFCHRQRISLRGHTREGKGSTSSLLPPLWRLPCRLTENFIIKHTKKWIIEKTLVLQLPTHPYNHFHLFIFCCCQDFTY